MTPSRPERPPRRRARILRHKPTLHEALTIWLPALALVIAAFWLTDRFVKPAPPDHIRLSTGAADGAYQQLALQYQRILARNGIRLELAPSSGSVENLARLRDDNAHVDAGFVQGGLGRLALEPVAETDATRLYSLGNLTYEGVWVFYRGKRELARLTELAGARVAVGAEGSGSRKVALDLFAAHGIDAKSARLSPFGGSAATDALKAGQLDAVFLIASAEAPVIRELAGAPGVRLMSFANAQAIARRFPYLAPVTLAQGVFDLKANLPPKDVQLLAARAGMVVREDLHPALVYLLLEAATEIHSAPGILNTAGEFPSPVATDFPLSEEAQRYYKSGPPLLQRYLPFWLANLVQRMLVFLLPIFGVLLPVVRFLPGMLTWRRRQRINRWYGELKTLEHDLAAREPSRAELGDHLQRLEEIEEAARELALPLDFSDKVYTLRQHIDFVRSRLTASTPAAAEVPHE
jgi:TRAP transporter TAXI family solute receptor